jgi:16S rRNA (cytosine967-C5)-methyltransferase
MSASVSRRIAFEILERVESQQAYASDLLHAKLAHAVSRADAALATELTLGVLRWQGLLDFLLQRHLDRPVARLDPQVLLALRIGLYQMRFLDRIPARAAVSESVELTKGARKRSAAPLVNAVLRRVAPEAAMAASQLPALLPAAASPAERLAILYSHPAWMVGRWLAHFGSERTTALLQANNRAPRLCCALAVPAEKDQVTASLRREGFEVAPGRWLEAAISISDGNSAEAEALRAGSIWLQDEASQMIARLVDARAGQTVLDVCAAPGGKTAILARAAGPQGCVVAADRHEHRLRSARRQLARSHTPCVSWLALDAERPLPFASRFPRILLDAPCSGTGTLARNPEIRWRLQASDLKNAHQRQTALLQHALAQLEPGGRLVYATCSLEPEENEQAVRQAVSQTPGVRIAAAAGPAALQPWLRAGLESSDLFDSEGFFRTFPPQSETDGFFAAILGRTAGT